MAKMRPLERCANGCDAPPKPPSKVICAECLEAIGRRLRMMLDRMSPASLHRPAAARRDREAEG